MGRGRKGKKEKGRKGKGDGKDAGIAPPKSQIRHCLHAPTVRTRAAKFAWMMNMLRSGRSQFLRTWLDSYFEKVGLTQPCSKRNAVEQFSRIYPPLHTGPLLFY